MADDINSVTLIGRLTRDPELSTTSSGAELLKISIASNRSVKKGEQWEDETSFFDITFWGKRAAGIAPHLKKGSKIGVTGSLKQERWEQDGQKRSKVIINAQSIQFLDTKQQAEQQEEPGYYSYPS